MEENIFFLTSLSFLSRPQDLESVLEKQPNSISILNAPIIVVVRNPENRSKIEPLLVRFFSKEGGNFLEGDTANLLRTCRIQNDTATKIRTISKDIFRRVIICNKRSPIEFRSFYLPDSDVDIDQLLSGIPCAEGDLFFYVRIICSQDALCDFLQNLEPRTPISPVGSYIIIPRQKRLWRFSDLYYLPPIEHGNSAAMLAELEVASGKGLLSAEQFMKCESIIGRLSKLAKARPALRLEKHRRIAGR